MLFLESKIIGNIRRLDELKKINTKVLDNVEYIKCGYKGYGEIPKSGWKDYDIRTYLTEIDEHYWFRLKLHTPKVEDNQVVMFKLHTSRENEWSADNPQGLIYINGKMQQAVDTNHTMVLLDADSDVEVVCYYYTGMKNVRSCFMPHLFVIDKTIEELYFDTIVLFESAKLLQNDENKTAILKHLEIALNMIRFNNVYSQEFYDGIASAKKYLAKEIYDKENDNCDVTVSCIGHTHIDIAWLWTIEQTVEKAQRSFSTVLNLMRQYPEYKFMSSQAILYEMVKEYAPDLYAEIKERVAEGRWEVDGAMWLECDCNLSSGESIIRQILYGKRFFKNEFGKESKTLWLPDTFGYSAAMPQILKKCGVDNFVTSKISWNDTNTIPHDTFLWQGIDGTEIFTNFMSAQRYKGYDFSERITTYVPQITPEYVLGSWARYQEKAYNNRTFLTYGFGDGGGGPTMEMLEYQRRLEKGVPGIPKTKITTSEEHLKTVKENFYRNCEIIGRIPKWNGELYLEFHRGTYTSIAKNKRYNRYSEFAIAKTEFLSSMSTLLLASKYPQKKIEDIWKLILLNQFHDILPGSSIKEVYEDSERQYEQILSDCRSIINDNVAVLAKNINTNGGLLVINSTYATGEFAINCEGKTIEIDEVPSFGWKVIKPEDIVESAVKVSDKIIENPFYKVKLNDDGTINSILDKANGRDIVKPGAKFNEIKIFEDYPRDYDNWEINEYYKSKSWEFGKLVSMTSVFDGTRAGIKIVRKYLKSTFEQTIWLYSKLQRIDFETEIDWHEHHQLVKAYFPINILANKARYDIQFGNVERTTHQNTSWDEAKFEVCAHKWADISDGGYGVSLLNDCKYGHSCIESELSLTFLKSGTYPNKEADQGKHVFKYAILPHIGDFKTSTVQEAYKFNQNLDTIKVDQNEGMLPENYSFISCDSENVVIETIKRSEESEGTIVRLFDAHNTTRDITLNFAQKINKAFICDMLENEIEELPVAHNEIKVRVKNYEIVTLKIV